MTSGVRPIIAGNWKMNGLRAAIAELDAMADGIAGATGNDPLLAVCLPFTLLMFASDRFAGKPLELGGQDCHTNEAGAHTGNISAEMLRDAGAGWVIVGHSERRADHGETDALVRSKAEAGKRAGLKAIICIGETRQQRDAGKTLEVLKTQMDGSLTEDGAFVIAYEPVWAIGTGLTPTVEDIREAHAFMRNYLVKRYGGAGRSVQLLYGGSVKPSNASEILAVENVDGALVGGASLKAADLLAIWKAIPN